ncbi:21107_t:CDS:1, partial [Rhizophagus irregularis]
MKRCLDEETPESISKPIKENTTPKEVVDIINDFRKEEKYQEIIQTSLINN